MGSSPLEYPSFSSEASAERDALFQPVGWMMGKSERETFNTQTKKRDKRREVRSIFITKLHVKSSEIRCLSSIVKYRKMTWMDQIFAKATQISCVEGNPLPPKKCDRSDYEKFICLDTKTTHTPPKVTEKIIRQKEKEDLWSENRFQSPAFVTRLLWLPVPKNSCWSGVLCTAPQQPQTSKKHPTVEEEAMIDLRSSRHRAKRFSLELRLQI